MIYGRGQTGKARQGKARQGWKLVEMRSSSMLSNGALLGSCTENGSEDRLRPRPTMVSSKGREFRMR